MNYTEMLFAFEVRQLAASRMTSDAEKACGEPFSEEKYTKELTRLKENWEPYIRDVLKDLEMTAAIIRSIASD